MSERLLRELSDVERAWYFRGVQPIWGGGLAEERFISFQRRLAASPEASGRYKLLGLFAGGEPVSALKAYELHASCRGASFRVLGIGAVFTPPEHRRQGHAARLLELAMDRAASEGLRAALLFSDIGAGYYERLGFRLLESRECLVDGTLLPRASGFSPAAPRDEQHLSRLFAGARGQGPELSLGRDGWTLRFQLRRLRELARARSVGEPEWGVCASAAGGEAGAMVRLTRDTLDVLDAAWTSEPAREALFGGLRDCLARSGRQTLKLWPAHQLRGLFPDLARTTALAMVAPLGAGAPLPDTLGAAELALLDHI